MKAILVIMVVLFGSSMAIAQDKTMDQDHVKMHEQMAKAHQQAAECLKSGKSEDECQKAFRETCKEMGGPAMCGMGKHHRRMKKEK